MQSKTIFGWATALLFASPALAQSSGYTLTTVYDATANGEWLPAAPVLGEDGVCFFALGSTSAPVRIVAATGPSVVDLGALPWPGVHGTRLHGRLKHARSRPVRILFRSHGTRLPSRLTTVRRT